MARITGLAACVVATLLFATAQGQAPAPAPAMMGAAGNTTVDGVFLLTAGTAVFSNATTLTLTQIPNITEYVVFPPSPRAGSLPQAQFASASLAPTNGSWLGAPQSALTGVYSGQQKTVLLQLSQPSYTPATNTLSLQYVVLPANSTKLPETGGTVNAYATQSSGAEGNAAATLPYVTPGSTTFYNASLSIDVAGIDKYLQGSEKYGLIRVDLGANNYFPGYYGK